MANTVSKSDISKIKAKTQDLDKMKGEIQRAVREFNKDVTNESKLRKIKSSLKSLTNKGDDIDRSLKEIQDRVRQGAVVREKAKQDLEKLPKLLTTLLQTLDELREAIDEAEHDQGKLTAALAELEAASDDLRANDEDGERRAIDPHEFVERVNTTGADKVKKICIKATQDYLENGNWRGHQFAGASADLGIALAVVAALRAASSALIAGVDKVRRAV